MTATLGEIILSVAEKKTEEDKINVLRDHLTNYGQDPALKNALQLLLDPRYRLDLPEGVPPFKDNNLPDGLGDTNLRTEMRRMYIFLSNSGVQQVRKELLFIQLLEGVAVSDAKLLLAIKEQKLDGVTGELVNKVFPGLILCEQAIDAPSTSDVVITEETTKIDEVKPKAKRKPRPKTSKVAPEST